MGFSGAAPEEKTVAATPAAPALAVVNEDEDIIAVLCAAVAACDGGDKLAAIGRLTGSQGWTNYARIAAVTNRDQMF